MQGNQNQRMVFWCLVATLASSLILYQQTEALPYSTRSRLMWNQFQEDYPEAAQDLLDRIENLAGVYVQQENAKRNLDLGLDRGFSGSQTAKHLMGFAAANFPGGPGRRRRSEHA